MIENPTEVQGRQWTCSQCKVSFKEVTIHKSCLSFCGMLNE